MNESGYNPYTYNPTLNTYFNTGRTSQLNLPPASAALVQNHPEFANHVNAMWSFIGWMQKSSPELYNTITNQRPELLDPAHVIPSGALSPSTKKAASNVVPITKGLKGLAAAGDVPLDTFVTIDASGNATPVVPDTSSNSPVTSWGQSILDTLKATAPAYFQLKSQNDLMTINVKRAEQGLPPIDSASLAPTVNVGVSSGVQTLGYVAIGGLMLVGLIAAMKKK